MKTVKKADTTDSDTILVFKTILLLLLLPDGGDNGADYDGDYDDNNDGGDNGADYDGDYDGDNECDYCI